jgi:hypothetical protein
VSGVRVGGPVTLVATIGSLSAATRVAVIPRRLPPCPHIEADDSEERRPTSETIGGWAGVEAEWHRIPVPAKAPHGGLEYRHGPGSPLNRYVPRRKLFLVECGTDLGIIWQNAATGTIYFTHLTADLTRSTSMAVAESADLLIAATLGDSAIYMLLAEDVPVFEERPLTVQLRSIGFGAFDGVHKATILDTTRSGFNAVAEPDDGVLFGHASLVYHRGRLGLLIGRTMLRSADGLNHQGGVAAVFDAASLVLTRLIPQTSGHSFQNHLTVDRGGRFLAIDMGDNFPRGINLHRFDEFDRRSQVVYGFKTRHGTTPKNPAGVTFPVYEEISTEGTTFYRWSNDNETYSELGAVIDVGDGYVTVFAGEPDAEGRALRNEAATGPATHARNVGVVKIAHDFADNRSTPNVVPDEIVLSQGVREDGAFYTFNGTLAPQRNVGVHWLTDDDDPRSSNATRVKAAAVDGGRIVVAWERWTRSSYVDTRVQVIDRDGHTVVGTVVLGTLPGALRFGRAEDPIVLDRRMLIVAGDASEPVLNVLVLALD